MLIYYDVTDLIRQADHPVTGIQRVVLEGLRGLRSGAIPIFLSPATGKWYMLTDFDVAAMQDLRRFQNLWERADLVAFPTHGNVRQYFAKFVPATKRLKYKAKLHQMLLDVPVLRRHLNRLTSRFVQPNLFVPRDWPNILRMPALQPGDKLVLFGTPWNALPAYDQFLNEQPAEVEKVFLVYDLIPLNSLFVPDGLRDVFRQFIPLVLRNATRVICNSESASNDLAAFARQHGQRLPPIARINLAHHMPPSNIHQGDHSLRVRKLFIEKYVLCVGSIESRKNHLNLLATWGKFVRSQDYNGEKLVLAGSWLWDFYAIQNLLHETGHLNGSITTIERPDDDELRQLYIHCRFTVYPSHYEGWGLPVGESLSFGKPCLHFDNSSLKEAGRGLTDVVPYHDLKWFYAAFRRLMLDDRYYQSRCANIANNMHLLRSWADFSHDTATLLRRGAGAVSVLR